jgi:AhpD family alkylhydroperoxidase
VNKPGSIDTYQEPSDLLRIPSMVAAAPTEGKAFLAFNAAAERSDGAIPAKYRELISLGVALTTQCSYCLDVHTHRALEAGATREELAETAFVAAAVRAGGSLGHGLLILKIAEAAQAGS